MILWEITSVRRGKLQRQAARSRNADSRNTKMVYKSGDEARVQPRRPAVCFCRILEFQHCAKPITRNNLNNSFGKIFSWFPFANSKLTKVSKSWAQIGRLILAPEKSGSNYSQRWKCINGSCSLRRHDLDLQWCPFEDTSSHDVSDFCAFL